MRVAPFVDYRQGVALGDDDQAYDQPLLSLLLEAMVAAVISQGLFPAAVQVMVRTPLGQGINSKSFFWPHHVLHHFAGLHKSPSHIASMSRIQTSRPIIVLDRKLSFDMSLRCQIPHLDTCRRTVLSADLALSTQCFHNSSALQSALAYRGASILLASFHP
jgi:hypothetical protein